MNRLLIAAAFIAAASASAQVPYELPIGGSARIRAYVLSQLAEGSTSIGAESEIITSDSQTFAWVKAKSPNKIMEGLSGFEYTIELTRPQDEGWSYTQLVDKNWNTLMWSYFPITIEREYGQWVISADSPSPRVSSYIPLEISRNQDVDSAVIKIYDENGSVIEFEELDVEEGTVWFPTRFADSDAELIVGIDCRQYVYGTKSGGALVCVIEASGKISQTLENYQEFSDAGMSAQAEIRATIIAQAGVGKAPPVIRVALTRRRMVNIRVRIVDQYGQVHLPAKCFWSPNDDPYMDMWFNLDHGQGGMSFDKGVHSFYFDKEELFPEELPRG